MTLQQLLYFQTACKYQNASRAAQELHVSQPSVSVAIKKLEEEFGVSLVKRSGSGFWLTEDGEALYKLAEGLLQHADSVERVMHDRVQKRSSIRLGMPPMTGNLLLSGIYADFGKTHSEIELLTKEAGRKDLYRMLKDDVLDAAFLPHREEVIREFPDCHALQMEEFEVVCCVPCSHFLAKRTVITPEQLKQEPLVVFSNDFYQNQLIFDMFQQSNVVPRIKHTSSQLSTVERLITDGIAIGFLFREVAESCAGMTGIAFEKPLYTRISLVWKKERYLSSAMQQFLSYCKKQSKKGDL